jgi:hypothetical protein
VKSKPDTQLSNFTSRRAPHIVKQLIGPLYQFACLFQQQSTHIREACAAATTAKKLSPDF